MLGRETIGLPRTAPKAGLLGHVLMIAIVAIGTYVLCHVAFTIDQAVGAKTSETGRGAPRSQR
jgi:hypothetical protein